MYVLRGGRVADAAGSREADVAIADGEIVAVGDDVDDAGDVDEEIDAARKTVAPGLIDAHVHVMMDGRPDVSTAVSESDYAASYRAASNLRAAVEAGVTTVRDLGSRGTLALDAGEAVAEGELDGARVLACGRNVIMTGGHGNWFGREADGPAEVRKAAREQLKAGADVLKCMATGGVLTEGAVTGAPELTPEELAAFTDAAAPTDTPTAAHAHGEAGIKNAVEAGITSVEHGTFMDREAAEMMADRGTYWVPTASALRGIVDNGIEAGIPEDAVAKAEDAADRFDDAWDHALDADVPIAMGTDAGTPFNFFEDIPQELAYMVDYGLSPEAALEAATVNAADLLGLDDVGRVEAGYRADLVLLDADPTEDVEAWREPAAVFAAGDRVA
ncbi:MULTISPECIES: amidohydrolase family protein [unclassified Halorubrum]|uniref:metal-dependent hydrolase family protein n=1 Tax=unclassified Halorubrum TaxID=2642239 RepID=UPI000B99CFBD|nr:MULTISPECIES: amidohydrolase family protein [unclassified Halorubrum]OYR45885.1 amidohydrolase [Halorubrum sp. Eb13]OYR52470.1 amidohydrolase [Halorubrum sp. Ea1]